MARFQSPSPFRDSAPWRAAWLAGVCVLLWQSAEGATDPKETPPQVTNPRIIERYKQMLSANPVEGTALERLWKIAEDEGFAGKLLEESGEAAAKGGFKEQMVYGLLLRRSAKEPEAIAAFRKAAESDPKSPLPHLALAPLLPPAERAAELETAVALTPADAATLPDQLQQLGDAWMIAGEPEKAADAWEKIVARSPGNLELRQKLAKIYAEKGMNDRALAHLAVMEKESDPARRVEALRAMARVHAMGGDPDAALASLTKAFGLTAPGHWMRPDLTAEMIRTAQEGERLDALKERWTAEAAERPSDPAPWLQLADLHGSEGALEAERTALEKAADLAPADGPLQIRLARLRLRLDDPAGAAAAYDRVPVDPAQPDPDLAFERAELDVRQGKPEAAQQRIEAIVAAMPDDAALGIRVVAFYRANRMHTALEKRLRAGNDPVTLAEYLFTQRRPEEARAVLRGLVRSGDSPEKQAAAHQKASDLFKQVGDSAAAVEALRAATVAQPDSAPLQLALGELLLSTPSGKAEARKAFSRAYALATTEEARLEADQRLFRIMEMGDDEETTAAEDPSTWSEARRAATALLSVPLREGGGEPTAKTTSLQAWIEELRQEAEKSGDPAAQLRLARWAFWSRDLHGALTAARKAVELDPKAVAPRELIVSIELAAGNRSVAIEQLQALVQIVPERKEAWQKQIAQTRFQMGQSDEAIQILEELAATGETGALTDLAQGQQQGDRWYDALATWEKLYQRSKGAKKAEMVAPIIRAMQRLEMNKRAAEFLWEAYREQTDEAARSSLLNDLILHCRTKGMTRWMVAQLEAQAASGDPADARALAQALKATGRGQEAFEQLQRAARSAKDRPAAEEELVRQAEELRDFAKAAEHQQLRLKFLPAPAAADWEKLAQLQESALDYAAADETRQQIARRFPRDSEALLKSARYFNKWGDTAKALGLLRRVRQVDPGNLEAAVWVIRNAAASDAERRKAATDLLAVAPSSTSDAGGLVLPPESEPFGNRLRACFATLSAGGRRGSEVKAWDENVLPTTETGWRLEAIRYLAARLTDDERPAWVERWSREKSRPSETLWALAGAGAHPELFAFLYEMTAAAPDDKGRAGALIWYGLRLGAWNELAEWIWNPQRKREDHDTFRMLLGEWTVLRLPLDPVLFAKATPSEAWGAAEVLAVRRRHADAAAIGRRLYEAMPASRGAVGLPLADWLLNAGETDSAMEIYGEIAKEPAVSLDAPTYAAQRALYLLLPELERNAWMADLLASLQSSPARPSGSNGTNGSPLHEVLSSALLHTLSGQTLVANENWRRLASLRAGVVEEEVPAVDRAWAFLLGTGVQLQQWGLHAAALTLWEQAVADPAAIRLQGERATVFAEEIQTRLAAIRLMRADRAQVGPILEEIVRSGVPASLNPLAGVLEAEGCRALSVQVLEAMQKAEARTPVMRLLAACNSTGDTDRAWAAVKRWEENPADDSVSAPAVLDFLAANDPAHALATAEKLAVASPGDQRVLERLALYRSQAGQPKEAAELYRKLIVMQPSLAGFRVGLADALEAQGNREAALEELKSAPKSHPSLEVKTVQLLAASGEGEEARVVAASLLRGNETGPFIKAVQSLAKSGRKNDALTLLAFAVDEASAANKSRGAFQLQREGVRLVGEDAVQRERWVRRLKSLAGTRPDLLSTYFQITSDPAIQPPPARYAELVELWDDGAGSPVAGTWLMQVSLERNPKAAEAILERLLEQPDLLDGLLIWLDAECKKANRHDLALQVNARLMQRSPDEVSYLMSRIVSLRALGREEEASQLIEAAQARSVLAPALNGQLALAAQEMGNNALARRLFIKAIAVDPAALKSEVYLGYARLLVVEGDFTAAKRTLRQAYRNPENRDSATVVEYLKQSGRPVASEVRDLELPAPVAREVEAQMAN